MTSKQYRKSSYVISAQVDTDKYVMLHGYSGAMDIVDKNIVLDLERHTFLMNVYCVSVLYFVEVVVSQKAKFIARK